MVAAALGQAKLFMLVVSQLQKDVSFTTEENVRI
jgi:hypothetical protein